MVPAAGAEVATADDCLRDADELTIVYVSKMFAVHPRDLPNRRWSNARQVRNNHELCIKNEELCIKNEELCI